MAKVEYNSTKADYVKLKFICNCGETIETGLIPVLSQYDNNKVINSFSHKEPIMCPKCKLQHTIHFYDDMYTAYVEIPTLYNDESFIFLHEIPCENVGDYDNALSDFVSETVKIKDILEKSKELEVYDSSVLYKMAVVYIIAIMDAYLGNLFRYNVNKYGLFKDRFLIFKSKTIKSNEKDILDRLNNQSFQNLDLIAIPYYKNIFGISISHNELIQNAVEIRNKIIHNSGRGKDGYEYSVTESYIQSLIEEITSLVKDVNQSMIDVICKEIIWPNIKNKEK